MVPGSIFAGDFRILRPLGQGGMGAVYLALQISTGRKRALKVLNPGLINHERIRQQFLAEARIAAELDSDHIADVVASGIDVSTGAPWFSTEYLEGETLKSRVHRTGRLPPSEVAEIMRQTCHAMSQAHAAGLVHRDLKPANLFVADPRRDGVLFTVKVLDFGIAKLVQDAHDASASAPIGSPMWMAPEQCGEHHAVPATDVWALGLIAYYCLVGRPFWRSADSHSTTALLAEMLTDHIPPASVRASEHGAALPVGFDEWFGRCVTREHARRFPDARHAFDALAWWANAAAPLQLVPPAPIPSGPRTLSAEPVLVAGDTRATQPPTWNANGGPPSSIPLEQTDGTFRPLTPGSIPPRSAGSASSPGRWVLVGGGVAALGLLGLGLLGALAVFAHVSGELPTIDFASNDDSRRQPSTPIPTSSAPAAASPESPPSEPKTATATATATAAPTPTAPPTAPPVSSPEKKSEPEAPTPSKPAAGPTGAQTGGFSALVLNCWKNTEGASAQSATSVSITLRVDGAGVVRSVRVDNAAAFPALRSCAVSNGASYRGFMNPPPTWSTTTFSVALPAAK